MAKPLPLLVGVLGIGATATGGVILMNRNGSGEGNGTAASSNTTTGQETTGTPAATEGAGSGVTTPETPRPGAGAGTGSVAENPTNPGPGGSGQGEGGNSNGASGGTVQTGGLQQTGQQTAAADLKFADVSAFKQSSTTSDCLKTDFTGLEIKDNSGIDFETGQPGSDKFFKGDEGASGTDTKSCLIINWRKGPRGDADKWNGKFTWLWTFKKGDEGFVNFNVMEPTTEAEKAKFAGVFYLVEKSADADKWEVKFKKEVKDSGKEIEITSLDDYFPKVGDAVKGDGDSQPKDYWGFTEAKDKLKEMCKADSDCATAPVTKKFHWTATTAEPPSSDAKILKDWSLDLKWWENIYGVKAKWDLDDKIQNYKGTWTEQKASVS